MSTDEKICLLDDLQNLLEKQIEMARRSDFRRVEMLAEQADCIVAEIIKTKAFEQPGFTVSRECITELYRKLELILMAGKDSTGKQLWQVGSGKKTLQIYRNSG